jgi:hypothetical protein
MIFGKNPMQETTNSYLPGAKFAILKYPFSLVIVPLELLLKYTLADAIGKLLSDPTTLPDKLNCAFATTKKKETVNKKEKRKNITKLLVTQY